MSWSSELPRAPGWYWRATKTGGCIAPTQVIHTPFALGSKALGYVSRTGSVLALPSKRAASLWWSEPLVEPPGPRPDEVAIDRRSEKEDEDV